MKINDKDLEIYNFIKDYALKTGFTPSIRQICEGVGLSSTNTVWVRIRKMEDYGLIIFNTNRKQYRLAGMRYVMDEVNNAEN